MSMTAREIEAAMLTRCTSIALQAEPGIAQDQREANIFRLAAMVVRSRFPQESSNLMQASEKYFAMYPQDKLPSGDVVRNGWILGAPRLRDMLTQQLRQRIA